MPIDLPKGSKILVRLPNWLGDVILCTPSLAALTTSRPDLRLTALVKRQALPAVEGVPGLDEIRVLDRTTPLETYRMGRSLKREGFEAALVFPKGFREALLARLAGIPHRIGLDTDRRGFLLTHPIPFTEEAWHLHHALQFGMVLGPLGLSPEGHPLSFPLNDSSREEAGRILSEHGLENSPFALFHVTASKAPRAWHPHRFAAVADRVHRELGLRPLLAGTKADRKVHEEIRGICPEAVDLAGETSLKGMAALMERADLFVGNDSGPMHIAAAVGAPVVALFGPGAPHKTAPFIPPERLRVIYAGLPCSPCRQAFFEECEPSPAGKPPCLEAITEDEVFEACLELVSR